MFSGGSEVPAISPSATLELPNDTDVCESDVTIDSCRIRVDCNPSNPTPVSGGKIAFGTTPPSVITSMPPAPGFVEFHGVGDVVAGQLVTFAVDGTGVVPAMSASVLAPSQVTITSDFRGTTISSGSDFVLTWTGGTTGTLDIGDVLGIDGDFTLIDCSFPAAAGSGVISMAALQKTPGGGLTRIGVSNDATEQAGEWTIDFEVGYDALWPDGSFAQGVLNVAP